MAKKFSDLRARMTPERLAKVSARTAEMLREMSLHELRLTRKLSQEHLAETLDTSQSSISKLERRVDVYVSTLRRYIESLGGELDIIARFPDGSVRINQFKDVNDAVSWARRRKP